MLLLPGTALLRPLGLFGPVRGFVTSTRFELTVGTTVFGVIAMTCLALTIAHLVTWARRRGAAYQHPTEALAWTGAVLAVGVTAFLWRPELYTVDRPVPRTCQETGGVQVCLHQADEPAREDVTSVAAALARAGLGPLLERVTDHAAAETDRPAQGEVFIGLDPGPFGARDAIHSVREEAADDIASPLITVPCDKVSGIDVASTDASYSLLARVLTLAGFDRLNENFGGHGGQATKFYDAMDAKELSIWVHRHREQIDNCHITTLAEK